MTCIRKVNAFDRFILRGHDPHEHACRLLVERLKWMTFAALMIAILGSGLMWQFNRADSQRARQELANVVAQDCVDRTGDIAFRNTLVDLVALNEGRKINDPAIDRLPRAQKTAAILRKGLSAAGNHPQCILNHVP